MVCWPISTPLVPRPMRVLDPACGDGRFLLAVAEALTGRGQRFELVGCDIDPEALDRVGDARIRTIHDDALAHDWGSEQFDLVIGNPPFLSQMAADTSRGGSSRHGGGPYADAAFEFLALAVRLANPDRRAGRAGAPPVDPRRPRRRTGPTIGGRAGRPLLVVVGAAAAALRRQRQRVRARVAATGNRRRPHRPAGRGS